MDGQLLQEAEKEREGIHASPVLSDISVFSALDHRYGWSASSFKVDSNEKRGGVRKVTVIQFLSGIVAIEGYLQFERGVSL